MKKSIKKQFIQALNSGNYVENDGTCMRNEAGFDVLGVLCDLHRKATKKKGWEAKGKMFSYKGSTHFLPDVVLEWAGIEAKGSSIGADGWVVSQLQRRLIPVFHDGKVTTLSELQTEGYNFQELTKFL